jgi:ABC-type polysaccharide transport system permease subunit
MDTGTLVLIEMILVIGAVLGIGFWQLYSVRRDIRRAKEEDEKRGGSR